MYFNVNYQNETCSVEIGRFRIINEDGNTYFDKLD
jgi:hypothetical protein